MYFFIFAGVIIGVWAISGLMGDGKHE